MKKYSIHFEKSQGRNTKSGIIIPTSYDFWEPLISYITKKSTKFRIDCWTGEEKAISEAGILEKYLI